MKNAIIFSLLMATTFTADAQFDGGADFVSRYLWRGQLLSSGPSIQPYISYSTEGEDVSFEIGAWGSYSFATTLSPDGTLTDGSEADLYFSVGVGDFSFGMTDYYFPSDEPFAVNDGYFTYSEDDGTNHQFELNAAYDGPVSISFNYNFYGVDSEDSFYAEIGLAPTDEVSVFAAFGNGWYTTPDADFGMVGLGVTYSKDIQITDAFSIPAFATFALNPESEKIFIIFGMSF